jgi:hypothetical protein
MTHFETVTAFRLLRRLTVGLGGSALYLLTYDEDAWPEIQNDLAEEAEVQLGHRLSLLRASEVLDSDRDFAHAGSIAAVWIDGWQPKLVALLDTHVVRLEQAGTPLLFFATQALSEKLLVEAPNFRSRLTEILSIVREGSGSPRA